jgi:hypothetical protein
MISSDDILKVKSQLTDKQFSRFIYYISKDRLLELKQLAKKKVDSKFFRIIRKSISININNLYKNPSIKRESINLLKQSKCTLKNVYKMIDKKSIVDANTLLRSSFENLVMAMMISSDKNTYNEFINLSTDDQSRNYTKPQKLRNNFRKILKQLDGSLFEDISSKKLKSILDDFYDKLSMYTHSTLIVNIMVELETTNNLDLYIFSLKQNTMILEILLYLCLRYLAGAKSVKLNTNFIAIEYLILLSDIDKNQVNKEMITKLQSLLHINVNQDYINNNSSDLDSIIKDVKSLNELIQSNPLGIISLLIEIIK